MMTSSSIFIIFFTPSNILKPQLIYSQWSNFNYFDIFKLQGQGNQTPIFYLNLNNTIILETDN